MTDTNFKPKDLKRIFLIRHGYSEGNEDLTKHRDVPDPAIKLTEEGKKQAVIAGQKLAQYFNEHPEIQGQRVRVWYSPYVRTTQTKDGFMEGFKEYAGIVDAVYQNPLLIEQKFGDFDGLTAKERQKKNPEAFKKMQNYSQNDAWFYATPPAGESRFDVVCRIQPFIGTIMRDAKKEENPIENIIVIAHGMSIRALMMNMLHKNIQWFDESENPGNCSIQLIEQSSETGRYCDRYIFDGFAAPKKIGQKKSAWKIPFFGRSKDED